MEKVSIEEVSGSEGIPAVWDLVDGDVPFDVPQQCASAMIDFQVSSHCQQRSTVAYL